MTGKGNNASNANMSSGDVVAKLLGFASSSQQSQQALKDFLDKQFSDVVDLPVNRADALKGLQKLDMQADSACCLFLLDALGNAEGPDEDFVRLTGTFLCICSKEIRKFPKRFAKLCKRFQAQTQKAGVHKQAIGPLISAIAKLEDSSQTITPIHPLLFQSCLLAEFLSAALPFLHSEVCVVNPSKNKLTMRDLLLFNYYGGLIHIGRRRYREAAALLLQAVTAPAVVPSAISLAAYRKYTLISLIQKGSVPELPRFTPSCMQRAIRQNCQEYHSINSSYSNTPLQLAKQDDPTHLKIVADGNGPLLNLALEAYTKREILRLTETYMTMPLQQISSAIRHSPAETELILLRMIENQEISAKIDHSRDLVSFEEDVGDTELSSMAQKIERQLQESMQLAQKVIALSNEVSCDKAFIQRTETHGPAVL